MAKYTGDDGQLWAVTQTLAEVNAGTAPSTALDSDDNIGQITSWSIDESLSTVPTTTMGDDTETFLSGKKAWTATVDFMWDDLDTQQAKMKIGDYLYCEFQPRGATSGLPEIKGFALVESFNQSAAINTPLAASVNLRGIGTLTRTAQS